MKNESKKERIRSGLWIALALIIIVFGMSLEYHWDHTVITYPKSEGR